MNPLGFGGMTMPGMPVAAGAVLLILILWSLLWKGLALWRAATRREKIWFVVFLIVNTFGILEIIYIFVVTKAKLSDFTGADHPHVS